MFNKFLSTIQKYNMLKMGTGVVIGVSGGPDSLSLLHLFLKIKGKDDLKIYVAHVNHNLRGEESEGDQKFVEEICAKWNVPLFIENSDISSVSKEKKISLEEAGRQVRYNFFENVRIKTGSDKIAVAQNKNDNAETILMRIVRGTGIEGLSGIKPVRDNIIRPLIEIGREEIEKYCTENNLQPRIDSSNLKKIYTRNKIRLELIPYIKNEFNSKIIDTINRMGSLVNADNSFILQCANDAVNEVIIERTPEYIKLSREKLIGFHEAVISRVIRILIENFCGNITDIEYVNIDNALEFLRSAKTGTAIDLPKGLKLKRSYNEFIILKDKGKSLDNSFFYDIKIPGITTIEEINANITVEISPFNKEIKSQSFIQIFDYDKIKGSLKVRNRQNGDIINPSGMNGTKKLKDYFIDTKVPKDLRGMIPLIALDKEILWIIGYRASEKYKAHADTKNVLLIKFSQ